MIFVKVFDRFNRPLQDLRISLTDRCNFRCQYCMPAEIFGPGYAFLPKEQILSFEEITTLGQIFAELGVKKLRLTGGEPLLRKDVAELIQRLLHIQGIEDIGLTTNGVLLTKQAKSLYEAGLRRLNISLDALNDDVFHRLNGRHIDAKYVLQGIDAALEAGFNVKVNMVVQKGINDQEIIPMASYFRKKKVTLRFIEFMDVGNTNEWKWEKVMTKQEIWEQLSSHFDLEPVEQAYFGEVAKRYRYKGEQTEIGFITSVSESFCSSCTRARISADGKLYTCLFANEGFDLKVLLRGGFSKEEIREKMIDIWSQRHDRYSDMRTEETRKNKKKIEMSYIGG